METEGCYARLVVALQSMGALMSTEQMRTVEEAAVVDDDGMVSYDDFRLALDKFAVQHPDDERVRLRLRLAFLIQVRGES